MGSIPVRVTKKEAVTLKRDRFFLRSLPASGTVPRVAYERTRAGERSPHASGRRDVSDSLSAKVSGAKYYEPNTFIIT